MIVVELFAKTDVGRVRSGNEDNYLVLDLATAQAWMCAGAGVPLEGVQKFEVDDAGLVLVVSDGMGGALAGDVASRMAVESVRDMLTADEEAANAGSDSEEAGCPPEVPLVECLRNATVYANLAINHRSQEDARYSGMGATLTGAAIRGDGLGLVQVGDSRAYLLRAGAIKQATKDQSLVQQLIDVGQISETEAETHMFRNVILQALGAQSDLTPVTGRISLRRGDVLLMCSDGLSGKLRAEDMLQIVTAAEGDLLRACSDLIDEANERGGEDNITVVLARFDGDGLQLPESGAITIEGSTLDDTTLGDMDATVVP